MARCADEWEDRKVFLEESGGLGERLHEACTK